MAVKGNRYAARGTKHTRGRKTAYRPEYAKRVFNLVLLKGNECTDKAIADHFEVSGACICRWKQRFHEFREAIDRAKEMDSIVAKSMYRKAIGYKIDSEELFFNKDATCPNCSALDRADPKCRLCGGSLKGVVTRVPIRKRYPPDTKACLAILARQHKSWVTRRAVEFAGTDGGPIVLSLDEVDVSELSNETLEAIQRDIENKRRRIEKGAKGDDKGRGNDLEDLAAAERR
jgi:hypothetical protein